MAALLNPRIWLAALLAALLAFTHFSAYRAGKAVVRADFDAYKLAQDQAIQKAQEEARKVEQDRQKQAQEAIDASKKREAALRADAAGARTALDRLRNAIRATDMSSGPGNAVRGPTTANQLLLECGTEAQRLAEAADQHASDVRTLTEAWPK